MLLSVLALALQAAAVPPTMECSAANTATCASSIFFDSGEGTQIRSEWNERLDAVANRLRGGGRLRVDAFSDRAGPAAANWRISQQRATAVLTALGSRGLKASLISVTYHGERDPLVPTEDGVREPQNRRVDLTVIP